LVLDQRLFRLRVSLRRGFDQAILTGS
jgi:hypothetical protein